MSMLLIALTTSLCSCWLSIQRDSPIKRAAYSSGCPLLGNKLMWIIICTPVFMLYLPAHSNHANSNQTLVYHRFCLKLTIEVVLFILRISKIILFSCNVELVRACPIWSEISNYFLTGQKSIPMVSSDFRF